MNTQKMNLSELSKNELESISGGNWIVDAGRWVGKKVGFAMDFLSRMDWTGNPMGY